MFVCLLFSFPLFYDSPSSPSLPPPSPALFFFVSVEFLQLLQLFYCYLGKATTGKTMPLPVRVVQHSSFCALIRPLLSRKKLLSLFYRHQAVQSGFTSKWEMKAQKLSVASLKWLQGVSCQLSDDYKWPVTENETISFYYIVIINACVSVVVKIPIQTQCLYHSVLEGQKWSMCFCSVFSVVAKFQLIYFQKGCLGQLNWAIKKTTKLD